VEKKVYKFNPERYYILSYYGIKEEDRVEIQRIVEDVKTKHGCQIIVNGLLPTIKYYLRLISSLEDFITEYSNLVEQDVELQKVHKEFWNEIVSNCL
jgi:DNA (cytosine-5)-methyltransferase 1